MLPHADLHEQLLDIVDLLKGLIRAPMVRSTLDFAPRFVSIGVQTISLTPVRCVHRTVLAVFFPLKLLTNFRSRWPILCDESARGLSSSSLSVSFITMFLSLLMSKRSQVLA